jgi:hypothetical protein
MAGRFGRVAGESKSEALRLNFDRRIKLHFQGDREVRSRSDSGFKARTNATGSLPDGPLVGIIVAGGQPSGGCPLRGFPP